MWKEKVDQILKPSKSFSREEIRCCGVGSAKKSIKCRLAILSVVLNRYKWTCSVRQTQHCGELNEGRRRREAAPLPDGINQHLFCCQLWMPKCILKKRSHYTEAKDYETERQKDLLNQTAHNLDNAFRQERTRNPSQLGQYNLFCPCTFWMRTLVL